MELRRGAPARGAPDPVAGSLGSIRIRIGEQATSLVAVAEGDDAHGLSQRLYPRRNGEVASAEYLITPQLIRDLAAQAPGRVSIEVGADEELHYTPWRPATGGLVALADALPREAR